MAEGGVSTGRWGTLKVALIARQGDEQGVGNEVILIVCSMGPVTAGEERDEVDENCFLMTLASSFLNCYADLFDV